MVKQLIDRYDAHISRIIEISIGLITWLVITMPIWASYLAPRVIVYFILLMTLYWAWKAIIHALSAVVGYFQIRHSEKIDWLKLCQDQKDYEKVRHIILIPNYKELQEKLEITLDYLSRQTLPTNKIAIILAMEEREGEKARQKAKYLIEKYHDKFGAIFATFHPEIYGEVVGKSSNQAWAGKIVKKKLIDIKGWLLDFTTITSCDADSLIPPAYFACLTYKFLTNKNRYNRFWQAHITEYSNVERTIFPIQLISSITSVMRLGYSLQGDFFIPYSTYSSSLKLIDEAGYWDVNVIPEDWHMFFKALFKKQGEVETESINLTIHGDAVEGENFLDAMKNRYTQNLRHAWGVSDIPYLIKQFLKQPKSHFWKKVHIIFRVYEHHFLWPTSWFLLTLGINIPLLLNPSLKQSVIGYNFSRISGDILSFSFLFTIFYITLDILSRPERKWGKTPWQKVKSIIKWFLVPVVSLFVSTLPGLDAHTRLMLNQKIEYVVAPKKVARKN